MKRRSQVDCDDLIPLLGGKRFNRRHKLNACVVDQNIAAARLLDQRATVCAF
ncbi:MAG: hypothetical protein ACD_10C00334G0001 [uncultured bacterium]|nr:MAG: hypothetical protein ACD_10C00334G0001 [uncultured bacterium]